MSGEFNDLRGVEHRSVHRDDAVVITGAEYMSTRLFADTCEHALDYFRARLHQTAHPNGPMDACPACRDELKRSGVSA